jgi:CRP/FNR family cyclic AMP-dependent transcriptional regulator
MPRMQPTEREARRLWEDVLACLPRAAIQSFGKGQQVYGPASDPNCIYLVVEGRVKLSRLTESGTTVVVNIYQAGDLFGESALLSVARKAEEAQALGACSLMAWSAAEVLALIASNPRLAVALMQVVAKRCLEFKNRLESFLADDASHRLARALLDFADRSDGNPDDHAIHIAPLTHELLAQYVGTSREIVSHHMAAFRRHGYVGYSRKGILVHRDVMRNWLLTKVKHA